MENFMKFIFLIMSVFIITVLADVVPHDKPYYTKKVRNTELIYTKDNIEFAKQAAAVELTLQPQYEDKYGYVMDEPLHVGLISSYNQIANGFSTQLPNNRQINYVGGVAAVDYFSSTSWLNTLLYHETAHNYQLNAKDNIISSSLHSVFGNGGIIIPIFTIPNFTESSFLIEGNAVLNESWHGNGGRLYSGRFKAATLMQAKAGYLTPQRVYNSNYFFLYGSHFYTLGGFYEKYLAENYGLTKVNSYWREHSKDWFWPFFTNNSMERSIGIDFEDSFDAWSKQMSKEAELLVEPKGEDIASSQFFYPLNGDKDEIYFMVNESGRERSELVIYDKKTKNVTKKRESWISGKVVKVDGRYTTQASSNTSPWRINMGLYDDGAFILESTKGKIIEGYLSDGRSVYFHVPSSFDQPQLYIGSEFYAQVNSSVFIDGDDVYYFVQNNKSRTLYKNKKALFTIKGYYSYISGIDSQGGVVFIANTEHGSGIFKFKDGKFTRLSDADTIIDARMVDDNHALIAAMGSDAFHYKVITLQNIDEAPYEVVLFVENQPYYHIDNPTKQEIAKQQIDLDEDYYSFLSMNYSASTISFGNDEDAGFIYNIDVNFADPLNQNALSVFVTRNIDEYTLAGASYINTQYFLQYMVRAYGVLDRPDDENTTNDIGEDDERDFGLILTASIPFVEVGRYSASLNGSYYQDYESHSREPLGVSLSLERFERYGVSMYPNSYINLTPYISIDRDDMSYGAKGDFQHELGMEFYIGINAQYSDSDAKNAIDERGIKISQIAFSLDGDPTTVTMPSVKDTLYVQSVAKGSLALRKVMNFSSYFFTFPLSLRRESLYGKYNYYDLESFNQDHSSVNEFTAGLTLDMLLLNVMPVPLSFEYIYNDNEDIADEHNFKFLFGFSF
jgi:hypothetical protein